MSAIDSDSLICEECEGPIDIPEDPTSDVTCCTGCGVAHFFQVAADNRTATRIA
jgi:hypothetical protein